MRPLPDNTHIPHIKRAISRLKGTNPTLLTPACKKLRKWMISSNTTATQLAMMTGFHPSSIKAFMSGTPNYYPTLAQAFAIEYVTSGFVPAYLWLDNPYIASRVRTSQLAGAKQFETRIKSFVLKFNTLKTNEGMIRHRARILSRLFGVEWGEVKRRCWDDAKEKAKPERANIQHLMTADITEEEHNAQD